MYQGRKAPLFKPKMKVVALDVVHDVFKTGLNEAHYDPRVSFWQFQFDKFLETVLRSCTTFFYFHS